MNDESGMADDVYQPTGTNEEQEDGSPLDLQDAVDERTYDDMLDEGYSPPEKWSAAQGFGNTEAEADQGETLDQRLAQEVPDIDPTAPVGEDVGGEVGSRRGGRLVEEDAGAATDTDAELFAIDVGIDGAGASAEEAAVHIIEDEDL